MKIIIVGAGIAGLTLANLLQGSKHELILVEKTEELKPFGFVVGVWKNGVEVLEKIGQLNPFKQKSFIPTYQDTYSSKGKLLRKTDFSKLNQKHGDAIRFIHRARLYEILIDKIEQDKIQLRLNSTVTEIEQTASKVYVSINGEKPIDADFVIGADGVNSSIRKLIFPNEDCIKQHDVSFATFLIENCFSEPLQGNEEYIGKGKLLGIYPYGEDKYGVYSSVNQAFSYKTKTSIEDVKDSFRDFGGNVKTMLDTIDSNTPVFADFIKEIHLEKWFKNRVILIGDAAHAMLPTTGQGLSAAMEDASDLFDLLFSENQSIDHNDFEKKLLAFQKKRYDKIKPLIRSSRINHYMWMNKNPLVCRLRNIALQYLPSSEQKLDRFFSKKTN